MSASDVHEALKALSPTDHAEFPSDPEALKDHLAASLADAHTLIWSVPPPAQLPESLALPELPNANISTYQKEWKPVKLNAKDNPLGISVFKLSAKDGKGTWFARRSIHTDIPFPRFKAGLQREFQQPKPEGDGAASSGAIRGIGKDSRIHHAACELGNAEIFQLSAQFPGPSAPRDFVEGLISSSAHHNDLPTANGSEAGSPSDRDGNEERKPKQFTLISKPVLNHPEAGERTGYVRGMYESIEFIREIPFIPKELGGMKSHSTPNVAAMEDHASSTRRRGNTVGVTPEEAAAASQKSAVDWIMITRSDPGGSVPRWMVERGTPGGIVSDALKFINWCKDNDSLDDTPEANGVTTTEQEKTDGFDGADELTEKSRRVAAETAAQDEPSQPQNTATAPNADAQPEVNNGPSTNHGLFGGMLNSLAGGVTTLAESALSSRSANPTPPSSSHSDNDTEAKEEAPSTSIAGDATDGDDDDDASSSASLRSFATCDSNYEGSEIPSLPSRTPSRASVGSHHTLGFGNNQSPEERALAAFLKEKQKLDEKIKREENKRTEREKKLQEKHMKHMEKQEKKYRRALEKANEKRRKEEEKREREAQKKLEREDGGRRKEIDELKKVVEGLTRENLMLRGRVEELEKERTASEQV